MKTYTSSLNEAFEKSSAEDRKVLRKYMRDVDFASDQWEYRNGKMVTTVYDANGQPILIEVDFNNERAEHDYAISALNIVERRVAI